MLETRWRRAAAVYLAVFFCAVAAAPHDHVNGLEDLLLDQPSNSGIIEQPLAHPIEGAAVTPLRYVHDISCPACFTSDFVMTGAAAIAVVPLLTPFARRPDAATAAHPELLPAEPASRAPPAA